MPTRKQAFCNSSLAQKLRPQGHGSDRRHFRLYVPSWRRAYPTNATIVRDPFASAHIQAALELRSSCTLKRRQPLFGARKKGFLRFRVIAAKTEKQPKAEQLSRRLTQASKAEAKKPPFSWPRFASRQRKQKNQIPPRESYLIHTGKLSDSAQAAPHRKAI